LLYTKQRLTALFPGIFNELLSKSSEVDFFTWHVPVSCLTEHILLSSVGQERDTTDDDSVDMVPQILFCAAENQLSLGHAAQEAGALHDMRERSGDTPWCRPYFTNCDRPRKSNQKKFQQQVNENQKFSPARGYLAAKGTDHRTAGAVVSAPTTSQLEQPTHRKLPLPAA
jgi:hypothetical protein